MALCVSNDLLALAACEICLTDHQLEVAKAALYCNWLNEISPDSDCSPNAVLDRGACFSCLTNTQLDMIIAQLLCDISA